MLNFAPIYTRWKNITAPDFGRQTDCMHDDLRDLFFSPDEDEFAVARRAREAEARLVCAECPFLIECALHGLEHEDFGVWGGLSEMDRSALGGRGVVGGGKRSVKTVVRNLMRAGISENTIKAIGTLWRARQAAIAAEEGQRGEMALVAPYDGEVA